MPAPQITLSVVSHRQNDHRIGDVPAFRGAVVKGAMRWSDIGSWSALWETDDAVLVASRDRAQEVKDVVARFDRHERSEHVSHSRVYRPWGYYESVDAGERFQVKRLVVKAGQALSLQRHRRRAEHWVVVSGRARVTRGEDTLYLEENQSTFIPVGTKHRLENPGDEPLYVIEVQSGVYLGEDDIERFDDRYNRR